MVPAAIATHPRFAAHDRRRRTWTRRRMSELHATHGHVSSGAGAMLVCAGWLYAAGECAAEVAGETLDFDMFRTAASLTATARQHELAAWELAAREGPAVEAARRKAEWERRCDADDDEEEQAT